MRRQSFRSRDEAELFLAAARRELLDRQERRARVRSVAALVRRLRREGRSHDAATVLLVARGTTMPRRRLLATLDALEPLCGTHTRAGRAALFAFLKLLDCARVSTEPPPPPPPLHGPHVEAARRPPRESRAFGRYYAVRNRSTASNLKGIT